MLFTALDEHLSPRIVTLFFFFFLPCSGNFSGFLSYLSHIRHSIVNYSHHGARDTPRAYGPKNWEFGLFDTLDPVKVFFLLPFPFPILQRKTLSHREIKSLGQGHAAWRPSRPLLTRHCAVRSKPFPFSLPQWQPEKTKNKRNEAGQRVE